jgi:hypothetical protein
VTIRAIAKRLGAMLLPLAATAALSASLALPAPPACGRRRRPVGSADFFVDLADGIFYGLVSDHNEVPGLSVGAGGSVNRRSQHLMHEFVRNHLIGEVADGALMAKQVVDVGDRFHALAP